MPNDFQSSAWHQAVGDIIAATDAKQIAVGLTDAIDLVANHEGTCLIAFHREARPDVLHHTLEPAGRRHYLERYLEGPYLLDPLYQLTLKNKEPSLCRFRDELPDRFRSSEYYRQYCERTHLLDEMDYLAPVSNRTSVVLVVGRRSRMFTKAEVHRLQVIEPMVQASLLRIWNTWISQTGNTRGKDDVHRRLTDCFENFGRTKLTKRERQISQLLLRGHSSKSVAQELKIAPGTVMVHKRNLFAKLGISSQYELFSLLIDDLSKM
ncbi:MAG: helix-turn-helix domain-containing protein [Woeseiaceae bacterium]